MSDRILENRYGLVRSQIVRPNSAVSESENGRNVVATLSPALLGLIAFWLFIVLLTPGAIGPTGTLVAATTSGFLALALCFGYLRQRGTISDGLLVFGLAAYLLRVGVGVWHYTAVMDSTYFDQNEPAYKYLADYEWLNFAASTVADYWHTHGFGSLPWDFLLKDKNTFLTPYFALLYYLGGNEHFLNFSVLNSLHACLVAALVASFSHRVSGPKLSRSIFPIALLQPLGFISSILWRDSVGQFFLIAGALMIIAAPRGIRGAVWILVGTLSLMLLRNVYFVIGIVTTAAKAIGGRRIGVPAVATGFLIVAILALVLVKYLTANVFVYDLSRADLTINNSIGAFVFNFTRGLVGPFPWTQLFDPRTPGREYMVPDILQASFNMAIVFLLGRGFYRGEIDLGRSAAFPTLAFVASIMLSGLLGYGHESYVTVGSVLALPLIPRLSIKQFARTFLAIQSAVIFAGTIWAESGLQGYLPR